MRQAFLALLLAVAASTALQAGEPDLLASKAIVTGIGADNRILGFRQCIPSMLVRLSGDQRLLHHPGLPALLDQPERHVASYSYRDRLEGVPIHDEQGSYARPHDLTCRFDPSHALAMLAELGSRPWPTPRPGLAFFVHVEQAGRSFTLTEGSAESPYMAESLALAAEPLALDVRLPASTGASTLDGALPGPDAFEALARQSGVRVPLAMTLHWSDADLGWIARFRMVDASGMHDWSARGISFDEAFRVGVRGAAQILSGNGAP